MFEWDLKFYILNHKDGKKRKLGKTTFLINIMSTKYHLTLSVNSIEIIFLLSRSSETDNEWNVFRIYECFNFSSRINSRTDLYVQRMMEI